MSFLIPAAFGLAALAGPLIVLYMLRSRRPRVEVASTMLWEKAEVPVSSAVPWQRLRWTPLLLLQLAVLAAFVVTLARPFYRESTLLGPHTVFVVDTSGSMDSADAPRYTVQLSQVISDLLDDKDELNVIRMSDNPFCWAGASSSLVISLDPADRNRFKRRLDAGTGRTLPSTNANWQMPMCGPPNRMRGSFGADASG